MPLVERQKERLAPLEARGHPHLVWVNGEMNKGAFLELEHQIAFVAVAHVLLLGLHSTLASERVLQFGGGNRQAIHGKRHVEDAPLGLAAGGLLDRGESDLPGDCQPVLGIERGRLRVHPRVRLEIGQPQRLAIAAEPVTKDMQRALGRQLLGKVGQHLILCLPLQQGFELIPFLSLRVLEKPHHIGREQAQVLIEVGRRTATVSPLRGQPVFNRLLKIGLGVPSHDVTHRNQRSEHHQFRCLLL